MPSFGITLVTGTLIEAVSVSMKSDVVVLTDFTGAFSEARAHDKKMTWSVKGKGDPIISSLGSTAAGPSNLSGLILVTSIKQNSSNTGYSGFEVSGEAYPTASVGSGGGGDGGI